MEALFLKFLNMSITAGYVVLAMAVMRIFLKRAPKKYSYLLWTAVFFRLVCPVSMSSVFSIFRLKLFNMAAAQGAGGAALTYIPANIGYMAVPEVTVGIPYMNSAISGSLPAAAPAASVNPMQIWISIGTLFWCAGAAALLIYGIVSLMRLKRWVSTAVLLEGNVSESDRIRSPFVLGLLRPRIYIPFGLGKAERAYILRHERCHIRRGDHFIKVLVFILVCLYWFNPLVWLAFILMSRDMEMSCDEKVLSDSGGKIAGDYGALLLSFAAKHRFPAAGPLAFGETGISERVKNILRFKKPKRWAAALTAAVCVAAVIFCALNPAKGKAAGGDGTIRGNYIFEQQIYMNPLSSFMVFDGYKQYYTLSGSSLTVTDADGTARTCPLTYEEKAVDEDGFYAGFMMEMGRPDISAYSERRQLAETTDFSGINYKILSMDGQIWLVGGRGDNIWSIYRIAKFGGSLPAAAAGNAAADTGGAHPLGQVG